MSILPSLTDYSEFLGQVHDARSLYPSDHTPASDDHKKPMLAHALSAKISAYGLE